MGEEMKTGTAMTEEKIQEPQVTETMEDYAAELEASLRRVREGDILRSEEHTSELQSPR